MNVDEMMCRWAEAKYGLANVTKVDFEPEAHGPYSEVTPDLDLHLEIDIQYGEGQRRSVEVGYTTDLIRELMQYAATASGQNGERDAD